MGLKGSMVKRDCAIVGKSWLMDVDLFFLYDGKFPREDVWNTGEKNLVDQLMVSLWGEECH